MLSRLRGWFIREVRSDRLRPDSTGRASSDETERGIAGGVRLRQRVAGAFGDSLQADQALVNQRLVVLLDRQHQPMTVIADGHGGAVISDNRDDQRA